MVCNSLSKRPVTHYLMVCNSLSKRKNSTNCSFVTVSLNGQFYLPIECTIRKCVTNCKQIVSLLLGVDTLHTIQDFPEFFQAPTPIVIPLSPEPVNGIVGRLA